MHKFLLARRISSCKINSFFGMSCKFDVYRVCFKKYVIEDCAITEGSINSTVKEEVMA